MPTLLNYKEGGVDISGIYLSKEQLARNYVSIKNNQLISTLWLWGDNDNGELGDNSLTDKSSPVQTVSTGTNWKQISCGNGHTAGIRSDNTLWLWGAQAGGGLGNNATLSASITSPIQTVAGGSVWAQVSLGNGFSGCIRTNGTLWMWGLGTTGQLGDGAATNRSSPVQVGALTIWSQISLGNAHAMAIRTDGTLWTWGANLTGQLGDNSLTQRNSPVQTISGGTNWYQAEAGESHSGAIKTDGTLWMWGSNTTGQLGDGTPTTKSSPVQTVAGGSNWAQVNCGSAHTAAVKTDGTLWLWGGNTNGELGDGTTVSKSSPVQTVAGGNDWVQVSCGANHTLALKLDGSLWVWGLNDIGQLGDGTQTNRSSPVQTVIPDKRWMLAVGGSGTGAVSNHSAALRELSEAIFNT